MNYFNKTLNIVFSITTTKFESLINTFGLVIFKAETYFLIRYYRKH